MILLNNEPLNKYTTIKIGGTAKNFFIPESVEELQGLVTKLAGEKVYFIAAGSNLLINDEKDFENVIFLLNFNKTFDFDAEKELVYVGASIRLQKLINAINGKGFGGIEYLYSVPASLGGAVVMNAGRGRKYGLAISDYLLYVDVLNGGKIEQYTKEQCQFSYRSSIFKGNEMIVIGAAFKFDKGTEDDFKKARDARIAFVKEHQDQTGYNFGTVYSDASPIAMRLAKRLYSNKSKSIAYSAKTANWIVNYGEGTFSQVRKLMNKTDKLNRFCGKKAKSEVIIWE